MGSHLHIAGKVRGEVVRISDGIATVIPFGTWEGISAGDRADMIEDDGVIRPDITWIGRVLDAFGNPLGDYAPTEGPVGYPYKANPPDALARRRVGEKLETAIKALDVFIPVCRGQRLGIFAGSGVGKSTTMAMLARQINVDVIVMGLVGERGREVQDFIERDLGPEGMARSVLIVATSDQPSLMRRQAAWTATSVAEYFRDQGLNVLLMIDSVTRFAMAQREIGLAAHEPPTTKGYTPTVFSELPRLLERSGPGNPEKNQGDITAIYTVLVDGDDMNEPIADAVRGILDGHIILDRKIAQRGRYPAIDILRSVSRMLPHCHTAAENAIMSRARMALDVSSEMEELAQIGAYQEGSKPDVDAAMAFAREAYEFLKQGTRAGLSSAESFANLYGLLESAGIAPGAEELAGD